MMLARELALDQERSRRIRGAASRFKSNKCKTRLSISPPCSCASQDRGEEAAGGRMQPGDRVGKAGGN